VLSNLVNGLTTLGNGPTIAYLFAGALIGVIIGVIPGLSTVMILTMILAFVNHLNLNAMLCLFMGATCGSFYSASIAAILLNTPPHPEAFPITLDGYPMARKGEPGRALGLSAASTCIGGILGCIVLLVCLPFFNNFAGVFHPPEYVALVLLALLLVATLGTNSVLKATASAGMGLMVASIGPAAITSQYRFTFGAAGLLGGISLVAIALGFFTMPQMIMVFGTGTATTRQSMTGEEVGPAEEVQMEGGHLSQIGGGVVETFRRWGTLLQGGIIGGITGIIPGIGGFTGNYMSYGLAKQLARKHRKELFGTGIPEGIIAPEASSLAKEAGHMVPLLALGIPGGVAGALFLAALSTKKIDPGYGFTTAFPTVPYSIIWIIVLSGVIGTVIGVLLGPQLAKITRLPGLFLVPFVLVLSVVGVFFNDLQFFSVMEFLIFGIVGLFLRRLRYPLGTFVIGLVLGPTFETNIYLTLRIYPGFTAFEKRPLADALVFITIVVVIAKAIELRGETKARKVTNAAELAHFDDPIERERIARAQVRRENPYPLLAILTTLSLFGVGTYFAAYGFTHFNEASGAMPDFAGLLVAASAVLLLPRDVVRFASYLRFKHEFAAAPAVPPATLEPVGVAQELSALPLSSAAVSQAMELDAPVVESPSPIEEEPHRPTIVERSWGRNGEYRRELICVIWSIVLVALCWFIGFSWGCVVFVVAYGMSSTRRNMPRLLPRVIFSAVSAGVVWLIIHEIFNITHAYFTTQIHF
jgi:putative tricarboxylic transport membrane protein